MIFEPSGEITVRVLLILEKLKKSPYIPNKSMIFVSRPAQSINYIDKVQNVYIRLDRFKRGYCNFAPIDRKGKILC